MVCSGVKTGLVSVRPATHLLWPSLQLHSNCRRTTTNLLLTLDTRTQPHSSREVTSTIFCVRAIFSMCGFWCYTWAPQQVALGACGTDWSRRAAYCWKHSVFPPLFLVSFSFGLFGWTVLAAEVTTLVSLEITDKASDTSSQQQPLSGVDSFRLKIKP